MRPIPEVQSVSICQLQHLKVGEQCNPGREEFGLGTSLESQKDRVQFHSVNDAEDPCPCEVGEQTTFLPFITTEMVLKPQLELGYSRDPDAKTKANFE